jgi:ABC-type transporter Mla maintaining outer membrane lipid asymmetry ATPase subunit MlaF
MKKRVALARAIISDPNPGHSEQEVRRQSLHLESVVNK